VKKAWTLIREKVYTLLGTRKLDSFGSLYEGNNLICLKHQCEIAACKKLTIGRAGNHKLRHVGHDTVQCVRHIE
jgi:hypothetical protein